MTSGMDNVALAAWGALFSGLGTLLVAIIGVAVLAYDLRLRGRQLSETIARANANISIDLHASVQSRVRKPLAKLEWILETRVVVTNGSSQIWAIPALYIHARAAPLTSEEVLTRTFSEMDFGSLQSCGELSRPINIARFPKSIFWLGPGETDSVVRWDVVADEFVREFPVIARHRKVVVTTAMEDIPRGPKKGGWAFLKVDGGEIDREKSVEFKSVLAKMSKAGRQTLVVFGGDSAANPIAPADA